MSQFSEQLLTDIRRATRMSDLVGEKTKLIRRGAGEFVGLSPFRADGSPDSFTVNDTKELAHDFATGETWDCFKFVQKIQGIDFPEAVKALAARAGITIAGASSGKPKQRPADSGGGAERGVSDARGDEPPHGEPAAKRKRREIVKSYDYTDAKGAPLYQVVRFEPKSFAQRRPSPDGDGAWVWGLDFRDADGNPLKFMRKGPGADWQRFDPEKYQNWHYTDEKSFAGDNVVHGLFNMPEIASMLELKPEERPTFHLMEGEKDALLLNGWGFVATTNSGGAKHWAQRHADLFAGCEVVIHQDNDEAGRARTEKVAPTLRKAGATVRVCDLANWWPGGAGMPDKADISDWAAAGGTTEKLYGVLEQLPEWTPAPYRSKYGAVDWSDQYQPGVRYEYLIKGVIPMGEPVLIIGRTQSGKSFETIDMAMHIAVPVKPQGYQGGPLMGRDFAGRRTRHGGVVYCAYEAGKGFRKRMNAYHKHHGLGLDGIPFTVLTRPVDLFSSDENIENLCDEIIALSERWDVPLSVVVIDTHNSATPGSSEVKSEDISTIIKRYRRIMERTGAGLWIVGHTNTEGRHRGNEQLANTIETVIEIGRQEDKSGDPFRDDDGRPVRRATVLKQREGEDRFHWDFVLKQVEIGRDEDGEPVTSCVSTEPRRERQAEVDRKEDRRKKPEGGGFWLKTDNQLKFFQALIRAMDGKSIPTPGSLNLPASVPKVVKWADVGIEYRRLVPIEEDEKPAVYRDRIKKRIKDVRELMLTYGVIGIDQIKGADGSEGFHVVWPTGRRVAGANFDWPAKPMLAAVAGTTVQPSGVDTTAPESGPEESQGEPDVLF